MVVLAAFLLLSDGNSHKGFEGYEACCDYGFRPSDEHPIDTYPLAQTYNARNATCDISGMAYLVYENTSFAPRAYCLLCCIANWFSYLLAFPCDFLPQL